MKTPGPGWERQVLSAVVVLLVVAVAAHAVWQLLGPLLPTLVVLVAVGCVMTALLKRR